MNHPYKLIALRNKKGIQFDISYVKQENYMEEAFECMRKQVQVPFEGNISLENLLSVIEKNIYPMQIIEKIKTDLLKLNILFYLNKSNDFDILLNKIKIDWNKLNIHSFSNEWLSNLDEFLSDRNRFLQTIETNKQDKKIKKLVVSGIVNDLKFRSWK